LGDECIQPSSVTSTSTSTSACSATTPNGDRRARQQEDLTELVDVGPPTADPPPWQFVLARPSSACAARRPRCPSRGQVVARPLGCSSTRRRVRRRRLDATSPSSCRTWPICQLPCTPA